MVLYILSAIVFATEQHLYDFHQSFVKLLLYIVIKLSQVFLQILKVIKILAFLLYLMNMAIDFQNQKTERILDFITLPFIAYMPHAIASKRRGKLMRWALAVFRPPNIH